MRWKLRLDHAQFGGLRTWFMDEKPQISHRHDAIISIYFQKDDSLLMLNAAGLKILELYPTTSQEVADDSSLD